MASAVQALSVTAFLPHLAILSYQFAAVAREAGKPIVDQPAQRRTPVQGHATIISGPRDRCGLLSQQARDPKHRATTPSTLPDRK
jgi:hypothetical protein